MDKYGDKACEKKQTPDFSSIKLRLFIFLPISIKLLKINKLHTVKFAKLNLYQKNSCQTVITRVSELSIV